MKSETDVLIIGAGPTGLAMACQFLRFGVRFRLLDQRASRVYDSRAFILQPRSLEVLQSLGLDDDVLELAQSDGHLKLFLENEKVIDQAMDELDAKGSPFPSLYFISQAETEKILIDDLEKRGGRIERQKEFLELTQDPKFVSVLVRHVTDQKTETIRCRYLIGCDGIFSPVRHATGVEIQRSEFEHEFLLADVPVSESVEEQKGISFHLCNHKLFLQSTLSPMLTRLMGVRLKGTKASERNPDVSEELEGLAREVTGKELHLPEPLWSSRYHLHLRLVAKFQVGRVFLAGDAAHVQSPLTGQGMNAGLQDAANLAWKIGFVIRKKAAPELLQTYHEERHRIAELQFRTTNMILQRLSSARSFTKKMKSVLLPILSSWFLGELGAEYPQGTFVKEDLRGSDDLFREGPKAGIRAPDVSLGKITLFELMKGKLAHVLIFAPSKTELRARNHDIRRIELFSPEMIRVLEFARTPEHEELFRRYGVSGSAVFFIRPDGYVGYRSCGEDLFGLTLYLLEMLPDPFVEISFIQQKHA